VAAARSVSGATPRRAALSGLRLALTSCAAGCREVVLDSTIRTKPSPSRAHAECVRRTVAVPALVRALNFLRSREWCTLTLVASCAPVELFVSRGLAAVRAEQGLSAPFELSRGWLRQAIDAVAVGLAVAGNVESLYECQVVVLLAALALEAPDSRSVH
ncbi:hypothetical protein BpHYR1_042003, partial [Brachionus plicatilis]